MFIRLPLYMMLVHFERMVMPRSFSRSLESMTRVIKPPSVTLSAVVLADEVGVKRSSCSAVRRFIVPDCRSSWSTSVVLPWSTANSKLVNW